MTLLFTNAFLSVEGKNSCAPVDIYSSHALVKVIYGLIFLGHHLTTIWRHLGSLTSANSLVVTKITSSSKWDRYSVMFVFLLLFTFSIVSSFNVLLGAFWLKKQRKDHGQETNKCEDFMSTHPLFFCYPICLVYCIYLTWLDRKLSLDIRISGMIHTDPDFPSIYQSMSTNVHFSSENENCAAPLNFRVVTTKLVRQETFSMVWHDSCKGGLVPVCLTPYHQAAEFWVICPDGWLDDGPAAGKQQRMQRWWWSW